MSVSVIILVGIGLAIIIFFLSRLFLTSPKISSLFDLIKTGKTSQAIKLARTLLSKQPRNAEVHYLLGQAYLSENKPDQALGEFKIVNQIGVFRGYLKEIDFRRKMAELYQTFGQPEEALKEYALLIKLDPKSAQNYYNIGVFLEKQNKPDQAFKYYKQCIKLDNGYIKAHINLGLLLFHSNRYTEAKEAFKATLKVDPSNAEVSYYLGRILKETQDFNNALIVFEKAVKSPEFKTKALVERGHCLLLLKNHEQAVIELERALKLLANENSQETLYARYFLAQAYEILHQLDQAIRQWEIIHAKNPRFKDVAEKLSIYQDLRTDDLMKEYLTKGKEDFVNLCQKLTQALDLSVEKIEELPKEVVKIIAIENASEKWRNIKRMPNILLFCRTSQPIEESLLREVHEDLRKMGAIRCYIITNTSFTPSAVAFSETRPFELMSKDQLQNLLKRIDT